MSTGNDRLFESLTERIHTLEVANNELKAALSTEARAKSAIQHDYVDLRDAWREARKTLPADPNLNAPWSQCIAIMDEVARRALETT